MSKKNIFMLIGVLVVIASCAFGYFTDVANNIPTLIGTAFGLGMEIVAVWAKSTKRNWMVITAIVCAVAGGLCCAFAGVAETTLTTLVTAVLGLVALLASLFVGFMAIKQNK